MKSDEKSPPAEARGPLDRSIRLELTSAGRSAGRASAGRPAARLDGPDPAAADRVSADRAFAGRLVGRHVDRLGHLAGRLDLDCWTLETSPYRGRTPQIFNETQ